MMVSGGGHVSPMMVGRRGSVRPPIVWGDVVTVVLGKHGVKIQLACLFLSPLGRGKIRSE